MEYILTFLCGKTQIFLRNLQDVAGSNTTHFCCERRGMKATPLGAYLWHVPRSSTLNGSHVPLQSSTRRNRSKSGVHRGCSANLRRGKHFCVGPHWGISHLVIFFWGSNKNLAVLLWALRSHQNNSSRSHPDRRKYQFEPVFSQGPDLLQFPVVYYSTHFNPFSWIYTWKCLTKQVSIIKSRHILSSTHYS